MSEFKGKRKLLSNPKKYYIWYMVNFDELMLSSIRPCDPRVKECIKSDGWVSAYYCGSIK